MKYGLIGNETSSKNDRVTFADIILVGEFTINLSAELINDTLDGFLLSGGTSGGGFELYRRAITGGNPGGGWAIFVNGASVSNANGSTWPHYDNTNHNPRTIQITRDAANLITVKNPDGGTELTYTFAGNLKINTLFSRAGGSFYRGVLFYGMEVINGEFYRKFDANLYDGINNTTLKTADGQGEGTLQNFPTDASQWFTYESGTEPASYAVELSATATLQLSAKKIGESVANVSSSAAASVSAYKVAQHQISISASADNSLANSKIGFGTASINASADINLISGNVILVEATISFNADASISLSGQKQAAGSVAFLSAANVQLSASKTGAASVNLTAGSLASLSANKTCAAAASLQCAVVHSLLSSKTGYSSFTVPVSVSITLSGFSAATKPLARAVFINTRSQQKSLLTTSSEQQRRITTHSKQRYSLQSGGASV